MMVEMNMLDHIVIHSMQVCRVATLLAGRLKDQGLFLNFDLVQAAALLHDITKTRSFQTAENHALTGGQFLSERGFPEVGDLVRQHVKLDEYHDPVMLGEAEIINYADKRVLHDEVVSIDKRLAYIIERYAKAPEHEQGIRWLWEKTRLIEDRIFRDLSIARQDLSDLVNAEDGSVDFGDYQKIRDGF